MNSKEQIKRSLGVGRKSGFQGMIDAGKPMKESERNNHLGVISNKPHSTGATLKDFFRAEAARYKETVIRSVPLSPLLPSEWARCARLIHEELRRARENVRYGAPRASDPFTFENCISTWAPAHVEIAAVLLAGLSAVVPRPEWKAMIADAIEALTKAVEELGRAEASRDNHSGSAWHLRQAERQIEAALAIHAGLMTTMGVDAI